jgi:hypothetical protein
MLSKYPCSNLSPRGSGYYLLLGVVVGDGIVVTVAGGAAEGQHADLPSIALYLPDTEPLKIVRLL